MSKKDKKHREEHPCFVCGKKPAYFQKGYMGGKYLCQTHAVHHLKFTRLTMIAGIIIAIVYIAIQ